MSVRAKFKVTKIECQSHSRRKAGKTGYQPQDMETVEMRTVILNPVHATDESENARFWNATPTGEVRLGTINPEAWSYFTLDKEYYLTFELAPEPAP